MNQIDIVLLSHSDVYHVGALPYLVGKLGLLSNTATNQTTDNTSTTTTTTTNTTDTTTTTTSLATNSHVKIFATLPVCKMGTMTMYDMFSNHEATSDFSVFNLDDVDMAFDSITQLKYSQRYVWKSQKSSSMLTIMPFNAGHSLGGTVWKIVKEMDEIVYAVDYNHQKERHLSGTAFDILGRPSILITDASSALNKVKYNAAHEQRMIGSIVETLRRGGNVLVPCDTAGRSLELALLLENEWRREKGLGVYPIIMLSPMSVRTIEFASHQLEWMSDEVMKAFHDNRINPFSFQYTHLCESLEAFDHRYGHGGRSGSVGGGGDRGDRDRGPPRVVLATTESIECGFSRALFERWASNPQNLILFTGRTREGSLARELVDHMREINEARLASTPKSFYPMHIEHRERVKLEGQELIEYEAAQQKLKEMEKKQKEDEKRKKVQGKVIQIRDDDSAVAKMMDEEDEDDDDDIMDEIYDDGASSAAATSLSQKDLSTSSAFQRRLFLPENMKYHSQFLMFPCIEHYPKSDVYGQWIDAEELKNRSLMIYEAETASTAANQMEIEEEEAAEPTKCITEHIVVEVRCGVDFIDYEGRSNAVSVRNILKQLAPRKLLLVHGTELETKTLLDTLIDMKISESVQAPRLNEMLEVSMDTNMFKVKLSQGLLDQVSFTKVGAYELAYIEGVYQFDDANQVHTGAVPQGMSEQDLAKLPSIVPLPETKQRGHPSVFIGDVKLSQFIDILKKNDIEAEFIQGGHLVYKDRVIIKRDGETGQITVEGAFCKDYFRIRSLLYSQYPVL